MVNFLIRAKKNTYAAKAPEILPSRPASHDLRYEAGEYLYIDTYLGASRFAGEEAVWHQGRPVYAMNYVGRVTGEGFSGDFLKAALMRVPEDKPFRGPALYEDGAFVYRCQVEGDTAFFSGKEDIYKEDALIYTCLFHGGAIE